MVLYISCSYPEGHEYDEMARLTLEKYPAMKLGLEDEKEAKVLLFFLVLFGDSISGKNGIMKCLLIAEV